MKKKQGGTKQYTTSDVQALDFTGRDARDQAESLTLRGVLVITLRAEHYRVKIQIGSVRNNREKNAMNI